jgi:anti-anti-sigma factor
VLDIATDRNAEARILVIHLRGRIDALTAREFDEFFEELLRSGERFFILRGNHLEAVSSAGIGSLVKFVRRLRGLGGGAVFVRLPDEIRLLLEFFGLGELLPVYENLDEARAALESSLVRFQDSLEIRRESTLRAQVRPDRNAARKQAPRTRRPDAQDPDVYARPLQGRDAEDPEPATSRVRSTAGGSGVRMFTEQTRDDRLHEYPAASSRVADQPHDGPTESELDIMTGTGPTESELELMSAAGPTESEREVMKASGSTGSEGAAHAASGASHRIKSSGQTLAQSPDLRYEHALLADELSLEAGSAEDRGEIDRIAHSSGEARAERWSESRVMGCDQCGLNLRVFNFGLHMCPACGIEFDVRRDGNVSFYEKL